MKTWYPSYEDEMKTLADLKTNSQFVILHFPYCNETKTYKLHGIIEIRYDGDELNDADIIEWFSGHDPGEMPKGYYEEMDGLLDEGKPWPKPYLQRIVSIDELSEFEEDDPHYPVKDYTLYPLGIFGELGDYGISITVEEYFDFINSPTIEDSLYYQRWVAHKKP